MGPLWCSVEPLVMARPLVESYTTFCLRQTVSHRYGAGGDLVEEGAGAADLH